MGPSVLEFSSEDPLARPAITALYHAAPGSDAPPTLRYRIERSTGGWTALAPARAPFGPGTLEDVYAFLEWRATEDLLAAPGAVFLHAAGVRIGGRSVLIIGESGSGKSSVAAHLFERGHPIWGDDLVSFATSQGLFSAAPRSMKLDAKSLANLHLIDSLCTEAARGTLFASGVAYVSPAAFRRGWRAPEAKVDAVVLLDRVMHNGQPALERVSEGEAAVAAARMLLGGGATSSRQELADLMAQILDAMRDMRAFRARGTPAAGIADAVERELAA